MPKVFHFNLLLTEYYCILYIYFFLFYLKIFLLNIHAILKILKCCTRWKQLKTTICLIVGYVDLNILSNFLNAADHSRPRGKYLVVVCFRENEVLPFWKSCCGHKLRVEVNKNKGVAVVIYCAIRNPRAPAATTIVF